MGMNAGYDTQIDAGTKNGYSFSGWTSSNGGSFSNASSASTTFTMPFCDTTIIANWTQNSNNPGDSSSTPQITSSTTGSGSNAVTTVSTQVSGTTSGGKQTVSITGNTMKGLMGAAKTADNPSGRSIVSIDTASGSKPTNVGITIPGAEFSAFAAGTDSALEFRTGIGTVTFSAGAVDTIASAGSGDVAFNIAVVTASSLNAAQQQAVGDRPVYSFSVTVGGETVSEFGSSVNVKLPYTLKDGEDPNAIVVYYVDASRNLQAMQGAYDAKTGTVSFISSHFSAYVIGYNKQSFNDVASTDWYSDAVTFIAARGITEGSSKGVFSPYTRVTRAQFLVMLMRAYGISADSNPSENFSDAGSSYYTGYLAAAKRLNISNGAGGNMFAPEKTISRQEMFTLLYNALKQIKQLPSGSSAKKTSDYSDASVIAPWAKEAITLLVETGKVTGSYGKLNPSGSTSRAEMAQVLYNLLSK